MPELKVVASYVGQNLDKGLKDLQQDLAKTALSAGKLDSKLATGLAKGSNSAAFALTNLGRVAQDAPFGFIGIQNNINPLLESFQRLKAETGSTGGALKALAGSLVGGAGIGLAISVVTSLLTVLTMNGFFKSKKAADDSAKSNKDFADSLKTVETQGIATGVKLQQFTDIARNQSLSLSTRNEALKQANKIFGEHGEKLTLVNIATAAVTEQINKFTQATIQQSLATKFADKAADLIIAQRDAQKSYTQALGEYNKEALKAQKLNANAVSGGAGGVGGLGNITGINNARKAYSALEVAAKSYKSVTAQLRDTFTSLSSAQVLSTSLFGELGEKTKEGAEKTKAAKKTISDVLAELAKEIDFLNKKEIAFNTNESKAKVSAYFKTIETLIKDFKPEKNLIDSLFYDAGGIKVRNFLKTFRTEVEANLIAAPLEIPVFQPKLMGENMFSGAGPEVMLPAISPDVLKKQAFLIGQGFNQGFVAGLNIEELNEAVDAALKSIQVQQTAATEIFSAIGESLGKAFATGGNFVANALSSILNIIGDYLVNLGKAAILASSVIQAIKAATPLKGIAAGLIAVVAGSILKNIKLPAFATGGVSPGGSILVGERGPEIISAPKGSVVTPNAQTNAILGRSAGVYIPSVTLRGQDLIIAFNRASDANRRNGQ